MSYSSFITEQIPFLPCLKYNPKVFKEEKKITFMFGNWLAEDCLEHISLQQSWTWLVHLNSVAQHELGQW